MHPQTFKLLHETATTSRPKGLFAELLGGDALVLHQDAEESPEKYDDGAISLLRRLVQGSQRKEELTPAERELLDRATLDFASYTKPAEKKVEPVRSMQKQAEEPEDGLSAEAFDDMPENNTSVYWWL